MLQKDMSWCVMQGELRRGNHGNPLWPEGWEGCKFKKEVNDGFLGHWPIGRLENKHKHEGDICVCFIAIASTFYFSKVENEN